MDTTTAFYDALAPMFDVMTDWDARLTAEGPFLQAQLDAVGARRVLDAACGSGGHALWLARQGYEVAGVDVSPVMIDLARQKARAARLDVKFRVADLANLQPANPEPATAYDAVFCLGNSLPHLLTQADLVARRGASWTGSRCSSGASPIMMCPPDASRSTSRCSVRANATGKSMFTRRRSGRSFASICSTGWLPPASGRRKPTVG
jgi:SAM-dependent methyltransferase